MGRSGVWQGTLNLAKRNTAWRGEFGNETAKRSKIQRHGNKNQRNEVSVASICGQNNVWRHCKFGTAKIEQCLQAKRKWSGIWAGDFSLSLLALVARLWAKFKGLFYSFCRSFFSSFCLQKAFFRTFCLFEIFKCFVFGLFALVIASRFCENGVAIHKFSVIFAFWIATLALLARNDGAFCHFEPFAKRRKIQRIESALAILGYFANAQYDKFGLLLKNNGYFHSKFKAFYKFNSFHKFYSNFKPYTRLFHIFTPNFRSVQTDKKFFLQGGHYV